MTEKQQKALDTILAAIPDDRRNSYQEIAEHAISLGYMPVLRGSRLPYADFSKSKVKRTLLKIDTNPKFGYTVSMKFYASPDYSGVFQSAIGARLETWKRLQYQAKCFGCGQCDGSEGYNVALENGEQGFLCGFGVLPLPQITTENIAEVKHAMEIQDNFFMKRLHDRKDGQK